MTASKEEKVAMHALCNEVVQAVGSHSYDGCSVHIYHKGSSAMALGLQSPNCLKETLQGTHTALMNLMKMNDVQPDSLNQVVDVEYEKLTLRKVQRN